MALNPATLNKRIDAAAALAGMSLERFGEALEAHGVNKTAPVQIKRNGSKNPPANTQQMNGAVAYAMSQVSGLPMDWFFEPDLNRLFAEASLQRDVDRLRADLAELVNALAQDQAGKSNGAVAQLAERWKPKHPRPDDKQLEG